MFRRIFGASAATLTCLALAGVAQAGQPTSFSGTVPNGGCDSTRTVTVNGPSRIEATVSSTASERGAYVQIVDANGNGLATGSYDTRGGGTYGIRVCTYWDSQNTPTMQYTAMYATGPAGQPALPRQQGQVLGVTTTLSHGIHGSGAIRTHSGLAWFTVSLGANGLATVKVFNPVSKQHMLFTRAHVAFGKTTVRIARGTMKLTLLESGVSQRITFRSPKFRASGWVVRGNFIVI